MGLQDIVLILAFAGLLGWMLYGLVKGTIAWKPPLILLVLLACALAVWFPGRYGPGQTLQPGLDLAGGTTLIYDVDVPDDVDNPSGVIDDLIDVLRDRVDPAGVRNLVWRQIAGNRIEIQMALASPETSQRRQALQQAINELETQNLRRSQIDRMLGLADASEREARIAELAGENEELAEALGELASLHERMERYRQPYEELRADHRQAEADLAQMEEDDEQYEEAQAQIEQLQEELDRRAADFVRARRAFSQQQERVLAFNVNIGALERALEMSRDPRRGEEISPRERELEALKAAHPQRSDSIARIMELHDRYDAVRGPLDDPNDLIALLRGSGVIEFRIAARPESEEIDADSMREALREEGPRAAAGQPWQWYRIDDVDYFAGRQEERDWLAEDAAGYFAQRYQLVGAEYGGQYYLLLADTPDRRLTRAEPDWELRTANRTTDGQGRPAVGFQMNSIGGQMMSRLTRPHVGEPMAILLDNRVLSAPTLQSQIGSRGQITGNFSQRDIDYLIQTLRAGSTQAELSEYPISQQTTGPQLGQDNLQAGMQAAIIALIVVALFIMGYYFFAGLIADFALLGNMVIILGVMALIDATFTLPGIAGLILTIGMAVDANVLIFERIREELERKTDMATAVRLGYDRALSTILDANITTLITCIVLGYTATAEVRGFAVVLGIGILATLFTALFGTRVILELYIHWVKAKRLPMLPTVVPTISRVLSPNVDWIGKRHAFFAMSLVVILVGGSVIYVRGEEMLDIEFRAGTQVNFELAEGELLPIGEARQRLADYGRVGQAMMSEGFDPAQLDAAERRIYEQLRPIVEDARQRQAEADVADRDRLDFSHLETANVVTVGETVQREGQTLASGFNIATLVTDQRVVSGVITSAFGDVLDEDLARPINFAGADEETIENAPAFPITSNDLGEVIDRLDVTGYDVQDYRGGVAIVLDQMDPAPTAQELRQRINRMRMDPQFQELGYRSFEVFGVEPAETDGDAERYRMAVVVSQDDRTNYIDAPDTFTDPTGLAATEWQVVVESLQRGASLGSVSNFSSQVSATMQQQAIAAIVLALLAVVAYIWFRFGSIRYGLAAIVALGHDVALALGLVALVGFFNSETNAVARWLLLDPFAVDLTVVAAMLTIIGYSLNDTIVVFDRIRENRGKLARETPAIINDSINQTISRTVITSGTTLLAVGILYAFGGAGIHGFAFTVLVGVMIGTYSSIAIAAPVLLLFPSKGKKPGETGARDEAASPQRAGEVAPSGTGD